MKALYLLLFTIVVVDLINDVDGFFWRRRRRRRSCSPVHCGSQWTSWSSCSCKNVQTRTLNIYRHPSCNGASCPTVRSQIRTCNGQCAANSGVCLSNGRCQCNPGKRGTKCELNCAPGTYGQNCARRCNCIGGASCDPKDGFCKCPVGRSGKHCQFRYQCQNPSLCFNSKNPVTNYRQCFIQAMVTRYPVSVRCPKPTHYINKCACYRNCIPVQMSSLGSCKCYCRNPYSSVIPASLRGKYITYATCCPMSRYWN